MCSINPLTSASWVTGTTGVYHHAQLTFNFSVEIGSHYVAQNGLKLLDTSDLPALAFQSVGIIGMRQVAQPDYCSSYDKS